ncbi:hypothetical protein ABW19_dt0210515 [Dactylella cylindrospora]|nr:hypothetical protein ABW19_dt0210515 [Dactylella cylindrospora]
MASSDSEPPSPIGSPPHVPEVIRLGQFELPVDLFEDILVYVPAVQFLTTCRQVCKAWGALIERPTNNVNLQGLRFYGCCLDPPDPDPRLNLEKSPIGLYIISIFWKKLTRGLDFLPSPPTPEVTIPFLHDLFVEFLPVSKHMIVLGGGGIHFLHPRVNKLMPEGRKHKVYAEFLQIFEETYKGIFKTSLTYALGNICSKVCWRLFCEDDSEAHNNTSEKWKWQERVYPIRLHLLRIAGDRGRNYHKLDPDFSNPFIPSVADVSRMVAMDGDRIVGEKAATEVPSTEARENKRCEIYVDYGAYDNWERATFVDGEEALVELVRHDCSQ